MITTRIPTSRSGSGAAHLGYAMFGARGPLREGEDAGGASGAGAGAGAAGAGDQSQGGVNGAPPKTFTQEQVDVIVKDRLDKAKRSQERQQPQPPAAKADDEHLTKGEQLSRVQTELAEMKARNAFDRRANKLGLSDEALDDMFTLYQAQKPENSDAWFESKSKLFGGTKQQTQPPPPAATEQQQQTEKKPPAAAPKAPGQIDAFVDTGGLVDIYQMTPEKLATLPPGKLRELHERNKEIVDRASGAPPMPRIGIAQRK